MTKNKHWSKTEIDFLVANYEELSNKEISEKINRTYEAVGYKLNFLKLKRSKKEPKKCSAENCDRFCNEKGGGNNLCSKHRQRLYRKSDKGRDILLKSSKKHRNSTSGKYYYGKWEAKKRNIEFLLTFEEYSKIIENKNCYYACGNNISDTCLSLDRVDNNKGYIVGNVVPCCINCNRLKNEFITGEEMFKIVELLKQIRNKSNIWEISNVGEN